MIADFILDLANVGWVDESEIALAVESAILVDQTLKLRSSFLLKSRVKMLKQNG